MSLLKQLLRLFMYVAFLGGTAAGGYYMWQNHQAKIAAQKEEAAKLAAAPRAPAVSVVKVASADFTETVMVSGSLVPREETLISPEIEGFRVLELFADEGSDVKKGQVLARLVPDQLEAQIAQNDASLANAQAGIARAQSLMKDAEAKQEQAKSDLERAVPLRKSGYLSQSVYDQREAASLSAAALVRAAQDALKAAEAQKAQVEAQRREIEWRRGKTEVTSPADGVVSRRNARIGAVASAVGEPMFRIIQNGEMELDAEIVETELYKVKPGQKAHITVPGATDIDGTVRLVSPEIDKTTRLGRVRIFLGRNAALHVGAFARGRIETKKSRGISVPPAAVMFDPEGAFVQVVMGDKIQRRLVKTGLISEGRVEIVSGLTEDELIVQKSGTFLRDGDVIRPITENDKTAEVN